MSLVTLKKNEGHSVKNGGLWIYNNEIENISGRFINGSIVDVEDIVHQYMGKGKFNKN